jgi:hypothetical protein
MSLNVYLILDTATLIKEINILIRENGQPRKLTLEEIKERFPHVENLIENENYEISNDAYEANITHNLNKMAGESGLYEYLWQPEKNNIFVAKELIEPLTKGLELLKSDPERFKQFNPSNGWGDYEGLVSFVEKYLSACKIYPQAKIRISK